MSRKATIESFQMKITRNDRFAQMSHQEKLIEQKKKEIQAKLEQKQKSVATTTTTDNTKSSTTNTTKQDKISQDSRKSTGSNFNVFSNDGSFMDQFKQMKEKKFDQKLKSFKRENQEKHNNNDERGNSKNSRWSQRRRSSSPKERNKIRMSRFSDKLATFDHKININTSYSSNTIITQQNTFDVQSQITQNVTGQPLLKNLLPPPGVAYQPTPTSAPVIIAPPVLLNVPPPQVLQSSGGSMGMPPPPPSATNILINAQTVQGAVLSGDHNPPPPVPPPPRLSTVELSSIPPPNPIQVHNIPQPDPINTLTIPPPAPIQVQNIPPPSPIQLNEIPNPKPLDILSIPTPNENVCGEQSISSDPPDFIKNIPPPNKSIPPPNLSETTVNLHVNIPPPAAAAAATAATSVTLPPPNVLPPPPPPPPPQSAIQNILVHSMPPPPQQYTQVAVVVQQQQQQQPPPPPSNTTIQPLMAHPVLPPPGMGLGAPPPPPPSHININCPPPILTNNPQQPQPQTVFVAQQLPPPPMNVPPPSSTGSSIINVDGMFKDLNAVFPPGSDDYEAMASLGRMVAQCGPGIEDIVRQRKPQDPSLWFLFYKDSAPYKQYEALIEQFRNEIAKSEIDSNAAAGEKYEPEMALEDDCDGVNQRDHVEDEESTATERKRKRKSRWGGQDTSVPPPVVLAPTPVGAPVMISKVTRNDPALLQYALTTFGSTNLSEDDWKKAEDHYKIHLLYQDMLRKRQELEKLQMQGRNKYDYDSDEDTDGGTWEHKLREKEMMATQLWAAELTKQAEGKHHIGDFLPPEELKRFLEKSTAAKEGRQPNISDYKEFKLKEDNIGFKMLQKLGWSEGQGLGSNGCGIVEPVNKAAVRDHNQGLGLDQPGSLDNNDDEYDAYRKRMMLAYRFRPNPLNNPRRPYY